MQDSIQLLAVAPGERAPGEVSLTEESPQVAIIKIRGVLTEDPMEGFFSKLLKGASVGTYEDLRELSRAVDAKIGPAGLLVYDGDLLGGTVHGVDTTSAVISGLSCRTAWWNSGTTASAGMLLSSAADRVAGSTMAEFGSMGAIIEFDDYSKARKKAGILRQVFASAPLKDLGSGSPEAKAHLQARVDATHERFRAIVAAGRGLSESDVDAAMSGKLFKTQEAIELGLVDDEFPTREAFIASLQQEKDGMPETLKEEAKAAPAATAAAAQVADPGNDAAATPPAEVAQAPSDAVPVTDMAAMIAEAVAEAVAPLQAQVETLSASAQASQADTDRAALMAAGFSGDLLSLHADSMARARKFEPEKAEATLDAIVKSFVPVAEASFYSDFRQGTTESSEIIAKAAEASGGDVNAYLRELDKLGALAGDAQVTIYEGAMPDA